MSGRTAAGLVLIVVGVVAALWGITLMNSFGQQMARETGVQDNTGPLVIGGGVALALIGLALAYRPLPAASAHRLTPVQWVICAMAAIGFAFDTYALLVLPLIVRPALLGIAKAKPATPDSNSSAGLLLY